MFFFSIANLSRIMKLQKNLRDVLGRDKWTYLAQIKLFLNTIYDTVLNNHKQKI